MIRPTAARSLAAERDFLGVLTNCVMVSRLGTWLLRAVAKVSRGGGYPSCADQTSGCRLLFRTHRRVAF